MLTGLKLNKLLEFYIWKRHTEDKAKTRWYYRHIPKQVIAAFTLAEVLITLLIIGVVASLVIPGLINNTQNAEYTTKLEKVFSTLSSGFKLIMAKTGCSDIVCTNIIDSNQDVTATNIKNAGVFSIIKKCNKGQYGCEDNQIYYLNSHASWGIPHDYYSLFVMNDGTVWGIYLPAPNCDTDNGAGRLANNCIQYGFIDINGQNPPNIWGRDIFIFYLLKDGGIIPVGTSNDTLFSPWNSGGTHNCIIGGTGFGYTCAARIVQEGWKMNY